MMSILTNKKHISKLKIKSIRFLSLFYVSVFAHRVFAEENNFILNSYGLNITNSLQGDSMNMGNFHGRPFLLNSDNPDFGNKSYEETWGANSNKNIADKELIKPTKVNLVSIGIENDFSFSFSNNSFSTRNLLFSSQTKTQTSAITSSTSHHNVYEALSSEEPQTKNLIKKIKESNSMYFKHPKTQILSRKESPTSKSQFEWGENAWSRKPSFVEEYKKFQNMHENDAKKHKISGLLIMIFIIYLIIE